jgi:hypothetical protein
MRLSRRSRKADPNTNCRAQPKFYGMHVNDAKKWKFSFE